MVKVKFIKDWGIYKKGDIKPISNKAMIKLFMEMEAIEITTEVKREFNHFDLLKRHGLNPTQASYSRGVVVEALKKKKFQ